MAYSEPEDIKVGSIPLPDYIDKTRLILDAADEIDSYIGFRYKTPVDMAENGPVARPARLLLKRISTHLTTGRLVLEVASSDETNRLHAYGQRLLAEAQAALRAIAAGEITLEGAELVEDETSDPTGPLLYNEDDRSQVEAFYDFFNPSNLRAFYR